MKAVNTFDIAVEYRFGSKCSLPLFPVQISLCSQFSQRTADSYTADLIDVLQFMFRRNAAADRIIPFFDISCNSLLQLMIQGT